MRNEKGSALVLVMISVVVLMLGGLAAVRSTESTALMAGNAAFRAATKQAADVGVSAAFAYVSVIADYDALVENRYFPLRQAEDSYGMPSSIDWERVPRTPITTAPNYTYQYVLERLCQGALPVTDTANQCLTDEQPTTGSKKIGSEAFTTAGVTIYRVTVRTLGPKNAESYTQALFSK